MTTFALIGAAGYVAPRHMQAIKDVGGKLVAALDPFDSVGILDSYSPECVFFKEPERFEAWLSKNPVDYVSICSPNYLHTPHSLMAMRNGCNVICEKPLALTEAELDTEAAWEVKTGKKVNAILQCRLHPEVVSAKEKISAGETYFVDVDYRTARGQWLTTTWKYDVMKSGGLPSNIGVHLFDLVHFLFGDVWHVGPSKVTAHRASGEVTFRHADMKWLLSIEPGERRRVFRIVPESAEPFQIDLTNGFTDLHTKSYQEILAGRGFGIEDARAAIRLVEAIRSANAD